MPHAAAPQRAAAFGALFLRLGERTRNSIPLERISPDQDRPALVATTFQE